VHLEDIRAHYKTLDSVYICPMFAKHRTFEMPPPISGVTRREHKDFHRWTGRRKETKRLGRRR